MPYTGRLVAFRNSEGQVAGQVGPTYLHDTEAAQAIRDARFPGDHIICLAVMREESWLSPDAQGDLLITDERYGPSAGVMQIRTAKGEPMEPLRDVQTNLARAASLYRARGWRPWGAHNSGAYREHLPWAAATFRTLDKEVRTLPTSQNGWPAGSASAIGVRPFVVAGVSFPGGVKDGDVATVLRYVMERFHTRVEPLRGGWCWGYANRDIRGSGTTSNHASGTATDANAPLHPLGKRGTFSSAQVREIRAILAEVDHVVRWGGDYSGRPDEMHFEINASAAKVAGVAARLGQEDYVPTKKEWDDLVQDVRDIKTYLGSKDPEEVGKAVGRGTILSDVDWKVKQAHREGFNHKTGAKDPIPDGDG